MIKEQEVKFKASKIIDYPGFRQSTKYSCGVATVQSALVYCFGSKYDMPESELFDKLKVTESGGVDPDKIMSFLKSRGLNVSSNILTVDDLKENVNKKIPTIICIQAWGKQKDYSKVYKEGHYVTVIGYNSDGFILEDPSISARYGFIGYDDLDERWHDVDKKGNKYDHLGIIINCKKKYSPEKMEVVEGKYMKNIVDKYLDTIQEGHPVLIGMGVLAAVIAGTYISDKIDKKKAERILTKNKPMVDKLVTSYLNKILAKAFPLGTALRNTLISKYKDIIKYWNEDQKNAVYNDLNNKDVYIKEIKRMINKYLTLLINKNKRITSKNERYIHFFGGHLNIRPTDDDAFNNAFHDKSDPFNTKEYPDEDNNPVLRKWENRYLEALRLIDKADNAIYPLIVGAINGILDSLAKSIVDNIKQEGVVHEAGFEDKPKGWTDQSIKKYSNTFSKKMKGGVKTKGFFDKCVKKMQGKMENPEGFCAALKDEAYGSTHWRGKDKSPSEVNKDVKKHQNVKEGMEYVDTFLNSLYTDNRSQAKEWRGTNIPYGDDSNRPNLIRKCMTLESDRQKINCLRRLREQAAMNPFYQARIDRFVDAITDTYEPTKNQGTIPGNEFKSSYVGDDLKESLINEEEGWKCQSARKQIEEGKKELYKAMKNLSTCKKDCHIYQELLKKAKQKIERGKARAGVFCV
jgi:predicted double-glycine peptidase